MIFPFFGEKTLGGGGDLPGLEEQPNQIFSRLFFSLKGPKAPKQRFLS
ncbi:hypothetical protein TDIS_0043 [Thermosulfurimonas dismutans]|uniref:Uncharacterized protein n=1 Tax=Thermosulfurimonas dismutans TaxID=999894 RepID=A0A179D601_9BACT|nr:hypothetical protein TDIS_0043 [Thermosulfurimonas dismutans]